MNCQLNNKNGSSCWNVNFIKVENTMIYIAIIGIILFFVHVGIIMSMCNSKFMWSSVSILLITLVIAIIYWLISMLNAKITMVDPTDIYTTDKKGDYWFSGAGKVFAYIILIGNIMFLLSLVGMMIYTKSFLYGCNSTFPWKTSGVLIITWVIGILYSLLKSIK
jgi:hypothetical protein